MGLEKLGLLLIYNYVNQMGTVRNHLQLALKEVLLAMQSTLEIINKIPSSALLGNKEIIDFLLTPAQRVINYTIEKVTPLDPAAVDSSLDNHQKLKSHIVTSIISAIDDEIESTQNLSEEKGKLKVEALLTVKEVLLNQTRINRSPIIETQFSKTKVA